MTEPSRGDVVLVRTRLTGSTEPSLRPALVLSTRTYRQGRGQMAVAAITTDAARLLPGDTAVERWQEAGLLGPSLVTGVLLTVSEASVERRLGSLAPADLQAVEASLRLGLGM